MIIVKNAEEIELMRESALIVSKTLGMLAKEVKPGVTTMQLDKLAEDFIRSQNAIPGFLGLYDFPNTLCMSPNEQVVHGFPTNDPLKEGDIISIDAGVSYEGYHADAAFTFGIGDISDEDRKLIETTKFALESAINLVEDGQKLGTIGHKIDKIATKKNYGNVRNYVGHGIGLEMHEAPQVPHYGKKNTGFELRTGMAICIEPMFNLGTRETEVDDDGWAVRTLDGKKSAHYEHTIGITEEGTRVFTENLF